MFYPTGQCVSRYGNPSRRRHSLRLELTTLCAQLVPGGGQEEKYANTWMYLGLTTSPPPNNQTCVLSYEAFPSRDTAEDRFSGNTMRDPSDLQIEGKGLSAPL